MKSTKHFINDPLELVVSACRGVIHSNPALSYDEEHRIIFRKSAPKNVAIISGGGAGHEPSFGGYVGENLLRAAVSGTIFASPSVKQIYNSITRFAEPNNGVLLIVMNYTGDVLHFGLASEKAKAAGLNVEMVIIADDVGVGREKGGKVGRRGIAGTVLVHKIAGAFAASGASLEETTKMARLVGSNLVSVGSSLQHVHIPGQPDTDTKGGLKQDEIELGMGIHNEQGSKRMQIPKLAVLVETMLKQLLDTSDADRNFLEPEAKVEGWVLLVNNLGGVSPLEMGAITAEAAVQLKKQYHIEPVRVYSGTFMTSLNGNGFSITLLRLVDTGSSRSFLDLLDVPTEAAGWSAFVKPETWKNKRQHVGSIAKQEELVIPPSDKRMDPQTFSSYLMKGTTALIKHAAEIDNLDAIVGDGDCGSGLKRGSEAIQTFIASSQVTSDAVVTIGKLADVIEDSMGGTSGAIYSIFTNALAKALRETEGKEVTTPVLSKALKGAMTGLGRYSAARPGDRTLVDALYPFVGTLADSGDLKAAAKKARDGAESTRTMKASLGRTVYINDTQDVPDPGAVGVAVFAEGLAE